MRSVEGRATQCSRTSVSHQGPITGPVTGSGLVHLAAQVPTSGQYGGRVAAHGLEVLVVMAVGDGVHPGFWADA